MIRNRIVPYSFSKRRLSLFRLNRLNCHKAGTGWCVKDGEAGSGDFAKQNTTPYPLHIRRFLLTENIAKLYYRHMEEKIHVPFFIFKFRKGIVYEKRNRYGRGKIHCKDAAYDRCL